MGAFDRFFPPVCEDAPEECVHGVEAGRFCDDCDGEDATNALDAEQDAEQDGEGGGE